MHGHPHPERYTLAQIRGFTTAIEAEHARARLESLDDDNALHGKPEDFRAHRRSLLKAAKRR